MTRVRPALPEPALSWDDHGSPRSSDFEDIYFNPGDGLAESTQVFLNGVGLDNLLTSRKAPVIAELGFGTGLNFLLTWQAWRRAGGTGRLHFVSVEGYPLRQHSLARALSAFPSLKAEAAELVANWPPPEAGQHSLWLDGGRVQLILLFGPVEKALATARFKADAWYLDGFAPARNAAMWDDAVLAAVAARSRPGARAATFTAAGAVRRGLAAVGFDVEKTPGFGRKRNRLIATYRGHDRDLQPEPIWAAQAAANVSAGSEPITIIGGGIAGACLAYHLNRRGQTARLIDAGTPPQPLAMVGPRLQAGDSPLARLQALAFVHAARFYDRMGDAWAGARGITLADSALPDWGSHWATEGSDGVHFPLGGCLRTEPVLRHLLADVEVIEGTVRSLTRCDTGWSLTLANGGALETPACVVAAGWQTGRIAITGIDPQWPVAFNAGLIALVSDHGGPAIGISDGKTLSAPVRMDDRAIRLLGSSFERTDDPETLDRSAALAGLLETPMADRYKLTPDQVIDTWAGVRANLPDHLPLSGPVCDARLLHKHFHDLSRDARDRRMGPIPPVPGLFILSGLGSRGFQYAPLLADDLAARMAGGPAVLDDALFAGVHPARFAIRAIIRKQTEKLARPQGSSP